MSTSMHRIELAIPTKRVTMRDFFLHANVQGFGRKNKFKG